MVMLVRCFKSGTQQLTLLTTTIDAKVPNENQHKSRNDASSTT